MNRYVYLNFLLNKEEYVESHYTTLEVIQIISKGEYPIY